jgi:hypothetical protein
MANNNLIGSFYLDKIINKYDMILEEQAEECSFLLKRFLTYKISNEELKKLSVNINDLSNTLKIVLELAIEKEIIIKKAI